MDVKHFPNDTKNSPSVEAFKHKLINNIIKPPLYCQSGLRLGQIYHARLLTVQKNYIDSPVCEYGDVENTSQILGQLRQDLSDRVSTSCEPAVSAFLYGCTDLSGDQNAEIFSAVQFYMY